MNYKLYMIAITVLTIMWGCSSGDSDDAVQPVPEPTPQSKYSVFTESDLPDWDINWYWLIQNPNWQDPEPTQYQLSMQIQVVLDEALTFYSTSNDEMAIFMDGTCRGVSKRQVIEQTGKVTFLMNISGNEHEIGNEMELRYYNAKLTHLFVNKVGLPFEPNNLWGDQYHLVQTIEKGSVKYPYTTRLQVVLPSEMPFKTSMNDRVYIFVDDECRGVFKHNENNVFTGYVFSKNKGETAEIRYFSSSMKGYYTILDVVTLNNENQSVIIKF